MPDLSNWQHLSCQIPTVAFLYLPSKGLCFGHTGGVHAARPPSRNNILKHIVLHFDYILCIITDEIIIARRPQTMVRDNS